jgi:hypothetical protein
MDGRSIASISRPEFREDQTFSRAMKGNSGEIPGIRIAVKMVTLSDIGRVLEQAPEFAP